MPAEIHGGDEHSLTRFESAHVFSDFRYFPGDVAAKDVRQFHSGQPLAYPYIQMIQRARPYTDHHLILAQRRIGDLLIAQNFRATELMNADCFHKKSPVSTNQRQAYWLGSGIPNPCRIRELTTKSAGVVTGLLHVGV